MTNPNPNPLPESYFYPHSHRSSVGTVLESVLPDPAQWTDNPLTRKSSYRKKKEQVPSETDETSATTVGEQTPVKQMMEFDEELGEFVEVSAAAPTSTQPPNEVSAAGPNSTPPRRRKKPKKRRRKGPSGRPPTHGGRKRPRKPQTSVPEPRQQLRRSPRLQQLGSDAE